MSRYQPLADFLADKKANQWEASFAEVEAQLGFPLPKSAYHYPAWWANQSGSGHSQTKGWRSAGWRTCALDLERRRVRFERERPQPPAPEADVMQESEGALYRQASELSGIEDRDALVNEGLRALIAREAAARLARLGGTMPDYRAPARERPGM